ncbi:MAG: zinc-binding metallopeptidase family protein [Pseudonocardiaceae bacterium]
MRSFRCPRCDQLVFFENTECLQCGTELGFVTERRSLIRFDDGTGLRRCANLRLASCNWLVTGMDPGALCLSCRLTRMRPPDSDADAMLAFADAEAAKRRVVFQMLELGLPLTSWIDEPGGLGYDLLSSRYEKVVTGHQDGIVTIDLAESDDPHRERVRQDMGEPYRTMLGHLRHETGHYYWAVLIEQTGWLARFRELFGDERADYGKAMERHYAQGAPAGWEAQHVSAYATMHPWEDWAETFAHYLHIHDTLQTAAAFGMRIEHREEALSACPAVDVDGEPFESIMADWLPLTYALNAVNRSMGRDDLYPFVLSPLVIDKLTWVHLVLTGHRQLLTSAFPLNEG